MLTRILVAVAGTSASPAKLRAVLDLAKDHGAEITALSVVDVERLRHIGAVPLGAEHHAEHWRDKRIRESYEAADRAIADVEALCADAGVRSRCLSVEGDPLDAVISAWRYQDLCVIGARSWFDHDVVVEPERALLKLVAAGVRPLLAATGRSKEAGTALIAYNGSLESAKAMKQFAQMRLWPKARLHIVCAGDAKTGEPAATILDEAAAYCRGQGFRCTTGRLDGRPYEALAREADAVDADVIVLGSSFRKVLTMQRFGTNALALLKTSDRPLFLSH